MFEIKKGKAPKSGEDKYPIQALEVDEYFEFPEDQRSAVRSSCYYETFGRSTGKKFTIRKINATTAACWRVS